MLYFSSKLKPFPFFLGENKLTCLTSWLLDSINSDSHTFGKNTCGGLLLMLKGPKQGFNVIIYLDN